MALHVEAGEQVVCGGGRGGVKRRVMSVREVTLQVSPAASLAPLDPTGSYLYVAALQMDEIMGLAEFVCV